MNPANLVKNKEYLYFDKVIQYTDHTINQRVFMGVTEPGKCYQLAESTVRAYITPKP